MQFRLEEMGANVEAAFRLLGAIEHRLDWGVCSDTCYECAKLGTLEALEAFFEDRGDADRAVSIARSEDPKCPKCIEWRRTHDQLGNRIDT